MRAPPCRPRQLARPSKFYAKQGSCFLVATLAIDDMAIACGRRCATGYPHCAGGESFWHIADFSRWRSQRSRSFVIGRDTQSERAVPDLAGHGSRAVLYALVHTDPRPSRCGKRQTYSDRRLRHARGALGRERGLWCVRQHG